MKNRPLFRASALILIAALVPLPVFSDDGIWLFNEFPKEILKKKYGFDASDEFLKKLQTGSVRFNNGGSGSFVSPDGLVFTNHHVASDCIQKVSTKDHDYIKDGFLAKTRAEEAKCPDLELNVLLQIENVTERVKGSAPESLSPAEAGRKRRSEMSSIEKECSTRTGNRCDVVTLFSGGQYHLYQYKKYSDVRLAFAPEKDIAFFGGDPDNFTYPRYDLDIAFFRVYENDQPAKPIHWFPFSKTGVQKGELTFVSGNPGSTGRLATFAELEFQRDLSIRNGMNRLRPIIAALEKFGAQGEEQKRISFETLFGMQNSMKAYTGFMGGLEDPKFMARKKAEESALRAAIVKDPEKLAKYGTAWDNLKSIYDNYRTFFFDFSLLEANVAPGSTLMEIGRGTYRYAHERTKPNADRLREYNEAGNESLEAELYSTAPIHPDLEQVVLTEYLKFLTEKLGAAHPVVKAILDGKTPEQAARLAVSTTKLIDVDFRKRIATSAQAADSTEDGILRIVRILDAPARAARKRYEDEVASRQNIETARIAQAQYSLGGNVYPDATFTLRLSFGPVVGYKNAKGQSVPYATDFAGLYKHATGKDPYALPPRWVPAKSKLNLKVPFNFVSTCDTHGGNSGSPTLNTKGEVIGILFDGNLEGLPNRYLFTDQMARSVHVASQGIIEALRKVYNADALLKELGF